MDFLTAEDWSSIWGAVLPAVIGLGGYAAWYTWRNHRAGKPLVEKGQLGLFLQNFLFIVFAMAMIPFMEIAERHGWAGWSWIVIAAPFVIAACIIGEVQRRFARKQAIANPAAAPVTKAPPSAEETRVNLKLNAVLIVFVLFTVLPITLIAFNVEALGAGAAAVAFVIASAALALLIWGFAGRWPWDVSMTTTLDIDAPPETVWQTVRFDAARGPWKKIVRRVEQLDAAGKRYRLHYFNNNLCASCGLPRDPESEGMNNTVEIFEEAYLRRLAWRATPQGPGTARAAMMDYEIEQLDVEALPGGRTRLKSTNTVVRPKVWLAIILKLGDATGEDLRALKAHVEGKADSTIYGTGAQRLEEARHAASFCGCPTGTPATGLFKPTA